MNWGKKCLRLLGWFFGLAAIGGPVVLVLLAEIDGIRSQRFFCIDWEIMGWHLLFLLIFLLPPIILTIWLLLERRGKLHRGIGVLMFIVYLISVLTAAPLGLLGLGFSMPYGSRTEEMATICSWMTTRMRRRPSFGISFRHSPARRTLPTATMPNTTPSTTSSMPAGRCRWRT